jgi:hypothetical protein
MVAAMAVEAATDGAVFHAWLDRVLLPELRRTKPDAVLVLDNLGAHRTPAVRDLLDRSGFAYRYLPSYSPDLNPIEPAWAKLKAERQIHRGLQRPATVPSRRGSVPPSRPPPGRILIRLSPLVSTEGVAGML